MEVHQMSNKHPILGRGELYVKDIEKRYYGGPQKLPHTYYENGPLFCAAVCDHETLERLAKFNPLRTIHPLGELNIPNMRGSSFFDAPVPPLYKGTPQMRIGVFDGGADSTLPHLKDFVTAHELTPITGHPALIAHGTAVCGAVLYGLLNYKSSTEQLETPIVSVDSYRVLPQQQTGNPIEDSGLYPAIDQIEQIVHNHTETALYNLSFGPRGAIVDDDISRFTYALDRLSMLPHHPLFCVAVGNDGDLPYPFNRIQAPADLVNGLGIGAYTFDRNGEKVRASYSCIGPGREGCKVKTDVLEFGGSPENPAVLISTIPNKATVECGTSFPLLLLLVS